MVVTISLLMMYQMWICNVMPLDPRQNNILLFNEFFLLVIMYLECFLALEPSFN